jgi:dolichol kinase
MTFGRELARKGLHLTFAAVPLSLTAGVPRLWVLTTLTAMLTVAALVEITRERVPAFAATFTRAVGPLLREREQRQVTGATWLILVCLAATWVLPVPGAIAVTWAAAVGDASAALVGIPFGGRLIPNGGRGKSVEGSTACFLVTLIGAYGLAGLSVRLAVLIAAAATMAEWPQTSIDDNVRVGAATAAAFILVKFLVHG